MDSQEQAANVMAFGEAIRDLIRAGEALSMFSPKGIDPGAYRRAAEQVRYDWDTALRKYQGMPMSGVVAALESALPTADRREAAPLPTLDLTMRVLLSYLDCGPAAAPYDEYRALESAIAEWMGNPSNSSNSSPALPREALEALEPFSAKYLEMSPRFTGREISDIMVPFAWLKAAHDARATLKGADNV